MKLKLRTILFEDPDSIWINNKSVVGSVTTQPNYAFGYYNLNQLFLGDAGEWHSHIADEYLDFDESLDRDKFDYPGRMWPDKKIISFWEFPDESKLVKIIKDLNGKIKEKKLKFKIDYSWKINTISENGNETLITISDYINKKMSPKTLLGIKNWNEFDEFEQSRFGKYVM